MTIQATDASGIHFIGVVKPSETSWTYSPTQTQHPTSASYSWTVRITNSGTLYYAAMDNGGNAPTVAQTPPVTLVVPPISPPSTPTASAATSVTSSGFTANWNSANGATGYRLDVSTSSSFASFVSGYQNLDVNNVNDRNVTGLAANTIHYYRVRAYNSGGASGNSGTINVTTLPNPPAAPTANAATSVTTSSFTANWSSASGATGYRLDVSTDNTFSSFVSGYQDLNVGNVTIRSVTGLSAGTTYYYRLRAYNTGGTSDNSSAISAATLPNPPAAPTATAATGVTNTGFNAKWNSTSGATGYRLDVSTNNTFSGYVSGFQDLDVSNTTIRNVSGLSAGTTYYYRVRAYNSGGTSGNSATIAVTTTTPSLAFIRQSNSFVLSWPTNDPAFKLYYTTNLPAAAWISNPVSPPIVSGQYTITNSMTNNARFYRLKK